jgi:hypothetical protein
LVFFFESNFLGNPDIIFNIYILIQTHT